MSVTKRAGIAIALSAVAGLAGWMHVAESDANAARLDVLTGPVLLWALTDDECVSCQLNPRTLRQGVGEWSGQVVVQRTKRDAATVDAFLKRERIQATTTDVAMVRLRAGEGGVWAVVDHGRVIARESYSPKIRGDGVRALSMVLRAAGVAAPGGEGH